MIKTDRGPAEMGELFGEFGVSTIKGRKSLFVTGGTLFIIQTGDVSAFAFVFRVAHGAFGLAIGVALAAHRGCEDGIMGPVGRTTEFVTINAARRQVIFAECGSQPL